jgi:hypothetical protein
MTIEQFYLAVTLQHLTLLYTYFNNGFRNKNINFAFYPQSSGYTSSGEGRQQGVLTPPTAPLVCLSIPKVSHVISPQGGGGA